MVLRVRKDGEEREKRVGRKESGRNSK